MTLQVDLQRLPHAADLPLPAAATAGAAGLDLCAAVPADAPLHIAPGARQLVPTGLIIALPQGTEAQIRPRSGLALRHGVTVLNAPATIDSDYRGEIQVLLINHGTSMFTVERGNRIAQLVIAHMEVIAWKLVYMVSETGRGAGGFGSTGGAANGDSV
jgi:dUTP pyrophosphatase